MKTRLLYVTTDLNIGGAEVMLRNLLMHLDYTAFECEVVSLVELGPIAEQIEAIGIRIHTLRMNPQKPSISAILELARIIRTFRPDIINTWMYHADLIGSIASLFSGFPPVVWGIHHTLGDQSELKPSTRKIIRINKWLSHILPKRIIICAAESVRHSHTKFGFSESKMVIINNGYDLAMYHSDASARSKFRSDHNLPPNAKLVGLFARYHPMKDHSTYIQAASYIHQKIPEAYFILAGNGIDGCNTQLTNEIHKAGINNNTLLLGLRKDMPYLLAALDIYVSASSRGEAFPLVIGEAMACGVPCVATDVGDTAKLIGNTGRIVPPMQPEVLAAACLDILNLPYDRWTELGNAARGRIEAEYNILAISEKYMDLYKEITVKRSSDAF
jgi:glycosyltransferase involved in cell wall biosynthesis